MGVAGAASQLHCSALSRIKLTFDEVQAVIKVIGTEPRAFMWLKALLC